MNILDITILAILAIGVCKGWHDGFIKSLCSFAGFAVGLFLAATFYNIVGERLAPHLGESAQAAPILAFILIWLVFPLVMSMAGDVFTRFVNVLCLGSINKTLGAMLGFVKYFLCSTLVVYVLVLMGLIPQDTTGCSFFGSMQTAFVDSFMTSFRESVQAA